MIVRIDLRDLELPIYDADVDLADAGIAGELTVRTDNANDVSRSSSTRYRSGRIAIGSDGGDRNRSSLDISEFVHYFDEMRYIEGYVHD